LELVVGFSIRTIRSGYFSVLTKSENQIFLTTHPGIDRTVPELNGYRIAQRLGVVGQVYPCSLEVDFSPISLDKYSCSQAARAAGESRNGGIYVLLKKRNAGKFDVVYVGMAGGQKAGARGRMMSHSRNRTKGKLWTHFSLFEVWDNITQAEVAELEGLFRHIYRKDSRANRINKQRSFKKLKKVRANNLKKW
jgi:hypothetical protein